MFSHGRLAKVMICLMAAMTAGALTLLALEGKPIKPMAFSLASQIRLPSIDAALGTEAGIEPGRWERIEITYRANTGQLSERYGLTGALALEYHFVIANGSGAEDGQIFASPHWVKQNPILTNSHGPDAQRTIHICLIRDSGQIASTSRQAHQLEALLESLYQHCQCQFKIDRKK